jgi:hypothetical protein
MDLAKMLALLDIIEPLATAGFRIWRQTRTGLLSYPLQIDAARAHLAASVYVQMAVQPHIVHVVEHTEAHRALLPKTIKPAGWLDGRRECLTWCAGHDQDPSTGTARRVSKRNKIYTASHSSLARLYRCSPLNHQFCQK